MRICCISPPTQTSEGNAQRQSLANEQERNLPGVILASREEFFIKMEKLCSLGSTRVIKEVRNLLMLVPTDSRILQALEVFSPQLGGGASEDLQEKGSTPQKVLEQLFSPSGTSSTQLLYHLEVCTCGWGNPVCWWGKSLTFSVLVGNPLFAVLWMGLYLLVKFLLRSSRFLAVV